MTLDTSVVLGLLRASDAHHRAAVDILGKHLDSTKLLPASAYAEILVRAIRTGTVAEIDAFVDDMGADVVPADRRIARRAAALRAEHRSLRLPDALVLATAHERATELITFDKRLQRVRDSR